MRIGRAEFVGEFRLSVERLCFCFVIYNTCEYIRLISNYDICITTDTL